MTEARAKQISGKSIGKAVLVSGICLLILLIVGCVISLVVHHEHHLCAPVALQPTLPGSRPNYTDEQLAQVGIKDAGGQQFRDEDSNEIVSDEQVADRMTHPPGMGISYYVINLFLGFVGLVFLIALFVELHRLSESQCPACRFYGMAVLLGNEHLGTREIHETRMQNVKVGEGISQMGRVIANYNVPVQERYVETHWREHCKCKYCGHQWSRQRRSQQRA